MNPGNNLNCTIRNYFKNCNWKGTSWLHEVSFFMSVNIMNTFCLQVKPLLWTITWINSGMEKLGSKGWKRTRKECSTFFPLTRQLSEWIVFMSLEITYSFSWLFSQFSWKLIFRGTLEWFTFFSYNTSPWCLKQIPWDVQNNLKSRHGFPEFPLLTCETIKNCYFETT